jgi:hypothetical protein
MKKQGWLDADFDVFDEAKSDKPWLLMDAVGGSFENFDYYLKYRHEGMQKSQILGCANMKDTSEHCFPHLSARRCWSVSPGRHARFSTWGRGSEGKISLTHARLLVRRRLHVVPSPAF